MSEGLLSIIVPVYNPGKYLEPLVESILNQSYKNIELILVNDGSTDNSGTICDSFSEKDSRITVIHKLNGGQSSARNYGLEIAKGQYIAFADNDDIVHPQMYADLIKEMDIKSADVCACGFLNVKEEAVSSLEFTEHNSIFSEMNKKSLLDDYFSPTWRIPVWNKVYRSTLVKELRFGNYHLGEDNLFSYEVIKNCQKYIFTDSVYYFQRMHGMNYEYTAVAYMTDLLKAKEMILQNIRQNFPDSYRICQKKFIYECIRIFNYYTDNELYKDKQYQCIDILAANCRPVFRCSIPLAHKLEIFRLIHKSRNSLPDRISL